MPMDRHMPLVHCCKEQALKTHCTIEKKYKLHILEEMEVHKLLAFFIFKHQQPEQEKSKSS